MEFTGRAFDINQDCSTGELRITFTANEPNIAKSAYDSIKDYEKLDIRVAKHRDKRSLDANAYAWVLMTKIADVLGSSKEEVYEEMLRRYGCLYEDENGHLVVTVKTTVDMSQVDGHWLLARKNEKWCSYLMIKGSSDYNTKEMSRFIDGVVSEAKELRIETLTPRKLGQMKRRWTP